MIEGDMRHEEVRKSYNQATRFEFKAPNYFFFKKLDVHATLFKKITLIEVDVE